MAVWDVLGKRTEDDELTVVGAVKAPDVDMALLLARECFFRHKEGVAYGVRRRGDETVHAGPYGKDLLGGLTDRSYRRQEAYAGVGGKLKRVHQEMEAKGMVIDRPRPRPGRARPRQRVTVGPEENPPSIRDIPPEDLAAHGTAG